MQKFEFTQPEFLFCKIVNKDDSLNDDRIWIYHIPSMSLIEFVCVDDFPDFQFRGKQDRFEYQDENWFGVFVQNNCLGTDYDDDSILSLSWNYLLDYFIWEDMQEEN